VNQALVGEEIISQGPAREWASSHGAVSGPQKSGGDFRSGVACGLSDERRRREATGICQARLDREFNY